MQTCLYTLPEINFIGGETQEFSLRLVDGAKNPFGLAQTAVVNFAICNYSNKNGESIISYSSGDETGNVVIGNNTGETTNSRVFITIPKTDTVNLAGKFIYQITIKSPASSQDTRLFSHIPNQGIMNIGTNINKAFILDDNSSD